MIEDFLAELERALPGEPADKAAVLAGVRDHLEEAERSGTLDAALARLGSAEEMVARMAARGPRHRHRDAVVLPDGTTVWATSWTNEYEREQPPDFGIYLDERWQPPWAHEHVDWPDFGVPADDAAATAALAAALERARRGETVELGCLGAHGRTGTALARLAVLAGLDGDPVEWVRTTYCERAIETEEQVAFARRPPPPRGPTPAG